MVYSKYGYFQKLDLEVSYCCTNSYDYSHDDDDDDDIQMKINLFENLQSVRIP